MKRKTNFDKYLEEQLKDKEFAERFKNAGDAWDIAIKLATLRKESGLSQKELAKRAGTTQQQISRLESPSYEGHYGIYRCNIYFSPAFAAKTGFTYYDLDNFLFALKHVFTDDKAAARSGMRVVGLIDFQHSTALGNEHAHKLFEMVPIRRSDLDENGKPVKEFPQSIADYCGEAPDGAVREKDQGGEGNALVTARKIIWEIPACQKENPEAQA